jgi:mono/diheme cytochrome c family protein
MTDEPSAAGQGHTDGLWRWLLGGLAGGAVVLGLLVAAYAIGYHRGQHHTAGTAAATTTTTAETSGAATTTPEQETVGPVQVTPALIARGKSLYESDGCSACHSLTGAPGAGPSFKGLSGGTSTLTTGQAVSADDAYLERSITDPDAEIVKGYQPGIMAAAIAGFGLDAKPGDIRALVAFIKSQT